MTGDFGLNFAPTAQNQQQNAQNGQSQSPIQDAIKVLSLRIPSFVGARGIAPNELLQGGGAAAAGGMGAGMPGGLEQFLRQLFGQMGGGPMGGGGLASPPQPHIGIGGSLGKTLAPPEPTPPMGTMPQPRMPDPMSSPTPRIGTMPQPRLQMPQ
jgi:hypothetical protein